MGRTLAFCSVLWLPLAVLAADEPPQVYVMPPKLADLPADLGATISAAVAKAATEEGLAVMTEEEANAVVQTMVNLESLGADATGIDLAALGRAIGSKYLIATTATRLGEDIALQVRLVHSENSKVLSREDVSTADHDGDLLKACSAVARRTLAPIFAHLKGQVRLEVSEEGANVLVDGKQVGVTPVDLLTLPGGYHTLTVTKDGFIRFQEDVRIGGEDLVQRMVRLRPSPEFLERYQDRASLYRTLAWVTTAVAVPLLGGSGVAAVLKSNQDAETQSITDEYNALDDRERALQQNDFEARRADSINSANTLGSTAVIVGAVGGVAALTTLYFWIFGDDPGRYDEFNTPPSTEPRQPTPGGPLRCHHT